MQPGMSSHSPEGIWKALIRGHSTERGQHWQSHFNLALEMASTHAGEPERVRKQIWRLSSCLLLCLG